MRRPDSAGHDADTTLRWSVSLALRFLRARWLLTTRFAVASAARMATAVAVILLIREFLTGVLDARVGPAGEVAQRLGPEVALGLVAAALLVTFLAGSLFDYDSQVVAQRLVRHVELSLMERLIAHLLHLPVAFYDQQRHGDLLDSVRQDVSRVRQALMASMNLCVQTAQAVAYVVAAVVISPLLAAASLPVFLLAAFPAWWVSRRLRQRSFRARRHGYMLSDLLLQIFRGIRIVKIYAGEEAETRNSIARARKYFDELVEMVRVKALADVALNTLGGLSIVIVTIVGGFLVLDASLSLPSLVAFLLAARAANGPLNNVNTEFAEIQRQWASLERLRTLLGTEPDVRDAEAAIPLTTPVETVELDRVSFAYPGAAPVLHDISLTVRAGEQIGVVGPSGSGKTTLVSLVARFYDPTAGRIVLNGRDLRDYQLASLHRHFAIVAQEPFVFSTSVGDNIRYGCPGAAADAIEAAARAAEIHDDIMALPDGYDTIIGVGGRQLSAGQVQRVNVARALIKNAPLLILDEATSNLDSISESKVQAAINHLMAGRTTFIVAHRLSTLRHASRILVLEGGRAIGIGTHATLVESCPFYERLWRMQTADAEASGPTLETGHSRHDLVLGEQGR